MAGFFDHNKTAQRWRSSADAAANMLDQFAISRKFAWMLRARTRCARITAAGPACALPGHAGVSPIAFIERHQKNGPPN
jgi:hypothetical protein